MNVTLYKQYLLEIVREALENSDGTPDGAAGYLLAQRKPGFLAKEERKQAFSRAQKVFATTRDRPLWFVLKCLDIKLEEVKPQ